MKKRLLVMLTAMMTMLVLVACGTDDETSSDTKEVFKVGMEAGYAPFNWTQMDDSNGAVKIDGAAEYAGGYDVEIAKKIAEDLGKELVIVKTEWTGLLPALQTGVVDAIIAGMSPSEERKESIDFTENYYTSDFVIITKKGGAYENAKTLADFGGAKITSQLGTTNYDVIDQIPDVKKQDAMEDFASIRVALQSGVIDGYVAERPEAISATAAIEDFTYAELADGFEVSIEDVSIAVGVKKDSKLTADMNKTIQGISEENRQKLMEEAIANQPSAQ